MSMIKRNQAKAMFHDAGIKRISQNALNALDMAISHLIESLAYDCEIVYSGLLIESGHLEKLCNVKDFMLRVDVDCLPDDNVIRDLLDSDKEDME